MATPVQQQYWDLKNQNPEAILFFRLGDFYEMFFEDASLVSRILGITLTARHRGTESEMPMCGFPYHSHKEYLEKLVNSGYKVAIAEQVEDEETKKITRKVARIVTPGTSLEDGNLDPEKNNFMASISFQEKNNTWAIAYSDLSTGELKTVLFENEYAFLDELYKINPSEILIPNKLFENEKFCAKLPSTHLTVRKNLNEKKALEVLSVQFENIEVFGIEKISLLLEVSAQILEYLFETQKSDISHIQKIQRYSTSDRMVLDAQTLRHLEIFQPIFLGENSATLLSVFEKSFTPMGARNLKYWVLNPLLKAEAIKVRLDAVAELTEHFDLLEKLSKTLRQISDLERILTRIVTNRGNARDLAFFRNSFAVFPAIKMILELSENVLLREKSELFLPFESLHSLLEENLVENPPLEITAGGIFQDGVSAELDELRVLSKDSKVWLEKFLETKKQESGISNLRIKFSKNFGFCLEVSKGQIQNVPASWTPRQTLTNATRFSTPELLEYETKVLSAESKTFELEHKMFQDLREKVVAKTREIQLVAQGIAEIDTLLVFARTAQKFRWAKPEIVECHESFLEIEKGRHPVVEKLSTEIFIANDLKMESVNARFQLLTGPNMAGKSTFLRQNCLIILLGQIGCFVPAKSAKFSVFDRIFTRVGASDNLAGGKSTFFVEMTETASIINAATNKSFVILDEIGRGTSTFDGISLAWAISEFLHKKKVFTLFASHYHELIELANDLSGAQNFHVSASQNEDGIIFLRRIKKGGISDSFGIEVAKLAGLPSSIIEEARDVLSRLESENLLSGKPNLFSIPKQERVVEGVKDSELEVFCKKINPDELSPKEALEKIYEICGLVEE